MEKEEKVQKTKPVDPYARLSKHLSAFSTEEKREDNPKEIKAGVSLESEKYQTFSAKFFGFFQKKIVKGLGVLILILIIFNFWFLRYDDFTNGCHIKIQYSLLELNNLEIKSALNFIREKSPKDYEKVCRYVKKIDLYLPCSSSNAGCFWDSDPQQIGVYTLKRDRNNDPSFTASVIYHETCHAIQVAENRTNGERETECYRESYRFLREVGVDDSQIYPNWKSYNK